MIKRKNLTLPEVLRTGRPYRRWCENYWRNPELRSAFTLEEIEAQDWEFKPEPLRLKIYVSPDRKQVSLSTDSPFDWDLIHMIEEDK